MIDRFIIANIGADFNMANAKENFLVIVVVSW